jgi:putative glutamine amidotransferase
MKPAIGITTSVEARQRARYASLSENYLHSVDAAGGLPLVLPTALGPADPAPYLDLIDGLLLSGGGDLSPLLYGEDPSPKVVSIDTGRDATELALVRGARSRGMPIFGICRGHQVVNVALGGDLWQDIPSQVEGATGHYPTGLAMDEPYHRIDLCGDDSIIREALRGGGPETPRTDRLAVNSFHHQAVKGLAPGLRVSALSLDGIIEAFEGSRGGPFLLCVQFHPESLTAGGGPFLDLFQLFVEAAGRYRDSKKPGA